jgi:hypothetical protein
MDSTSTDESSATPSLFSVDDDEMMKSDSGITTQQATFFERSSPIHLHDVTDERFPETKELTNDKKVSVDDLEMQFMETDLVEYKARILFVLVLTLLGYMGETYMSYTYIIDYVKRVSGGDRVNLLFQDFELMLMHRGYKFAEFELSIRFSSILSVGTLLSWIMAVVLTPNSHHDSVMFFFSFAFLTIMTYFSYNILLLSSYKLVAGCEYIAPHLDDTPSYFPFRPLVGFNDLSREGNPIVCEYYTRS